MLEKGTHYGFYCKIYVIRLHSVLNQYFYSAERAEGPTTVCHIHTLEPNEGIDLQFDDAEKLNGSYTLNYFSQPFTESLKSS